MRKIQEINNMPTMFYKNLYITILFVIIGKRNY